MKSILKTAIAVVTIFSLVGCGGGGVSNPTAPGGEPYVDRSVTFSGLQWQVRNDPSRLGPGNNFFSANTDNVWVDSMGRLHLKITCRKGVWYCAEVVCKDSLGNGLYVFKVDEVKNLDPATAGLFLWDPTGGYAHNETDVEISNWGNSGQANCQYVVQPDQPGRKYRFDIDLGLSTHSFDWHTDKIVFASQSDKGASSWTFDGSNIPQPGHESMRLNLWLHGASAPVVGHEPEIVISSVTWSPS